jgi:hypothetical protein
MPRGIPSPTSLAFSAQALREKLLEGVELPADFVNKALRVLDEQMVATQTKFFAHKGIVKDAKVVEDNASRIAAASAVIGMTPLRQREALPESSTPTIALEVDPVTGVTRIVVGDIPPSSRSVENVEPSRAEPVSRPLSTSRGSDGVWKI